MEIIEKKLETNNFIKDEQNLNTLLNNNNGKSSTTFDHLLEIQNLVKKESALKELCKKELFNLKN
jgi:hypothetical protein